MIAFLVHSGNDYETAMLELHSDEYSIDLFFGEGLRRAATVKKNLIKSSKKGKKTLSSASHDSYS